MEASPLSDLVIKSSIREYEVVFSSSLYDLLREELTDEDVIIIDSRVVEHLAEDVQSIITRSRHIQIEAIEEQKSYVALTPLIEQLIDQKFRKNNRLIAVGGGITQDITAFIASIMLRGVEWLFIPTTLLAQADSCIGGKTSINIGKFKNQLGNFYPPRKIIIVSEVIKSLPESDFKSGMGEMLHFYLVSGEKDYDLYTRSFEQAFHNEHILLSLIKRNLEIKKGFIERDEFDRGERQLLNYGHSFGHAIETLTRYAIPHGIAVSYGMDMANFISVKLGFLQNSERVRIKQQLMKIWEGTSINNISIQEYERALSRDKKNIGNTYQLILTKGIGKMFKHGVVPDKVFTFWLHDYFQELGV